MAKQIDYKERQIIDLWLKYGKKLREIARHLGRSPNSISSEVRNNSDVSGYHAISAQVRSEKRLHKSRSQNSSKKDDVWDYVINKLRCGWSPEQIAGRLKRERVKTMICHETIYRYIYSHPEKQLTQYLVRNHKKRRKRSCDNWNWLPRRGISNRVSIHNRPEEINSKTTFGHWEDDVVEGRRKTGAVVTALERKTRYYAAQKIPTINSDEGIKAQKTIISKYPKEATN